MEKQMIFDLSTHKTAEESRVLYKQDKINNAYFYHFTTYPTEMENDLYGGLRPLSKVITDPTTPLGTFLAQNNIYFYYQDGTPFIKYNDQPYSVATGGVWNDVAARLEWDNGISGFFIPYNFDYSCICECPEILRSLDNSIYKLGNIENRPLNSSLQIKWKQKNIKTYMVKCLVPINKIMKKKPDFFEDAAKQAANHNFSSIDYMSEFVYVEDKNCNMIEVKNVKKFNK
ncbi:MAG: hypothetical protein ACI4UB_01695 [Limosilactobacillus sp.]